MALIDISFELESCIRGHHIYKDVWTPVVHEELNCRREERNISDPYAVAIIKSGNIVGHVPRRISTACNLFIQKGGVIVCTVTGPRRYSSDLPQGGLEVPCRLSFRGDSKLITKLNRLLRSDATNCKKPTENECEAGNSFKTADVENPHKKQKIGEPAAAAVSSPVISVDDSTLDTVSSKVWIAFGQKVLTEVDKDIVMLGEKLNDKHMNFAQALIKKQFSNLSGLHSTLTIFQLQAPIVSENVLQILHIGGDHWVVASNIGCTTGEVNLYDSLYIVVSTATQMLLKKVFGNAKITLPQCPKQSGSYDCGLFAIAFCNALAHGVPLSEVTFNQHTMRHRLIKCFEQLEMTPFQTM